jgi:hypothetical protein
VVTAASSASISTSSKRFSAPARSSGKKWRCCGTRVSGRPRPLEQPTVRPPSRSVEPKTGLVLSPRAAGLACPNYAAGGPSRQQLAGLTTPQRPGLDRPVEAAGRPRARSRHIWSKVDFALRLAGHTGRQGMWQVSKPPSGQKGEQNCAQDGSDNNHIDQVVRGYRKCRGHIGERPVRLCLLAS